MSKDINILIVEDSPTQAEQLKHLLEKKGYMVNIANNGKQALTMVKKYNTSLILSDIMMPEIDGYTFCKKIKSDEKLKYIPVILVTYLSDPQDIIKGLEAGADNFIMKPYNEKYLLYLIQNILVNRELRPVESVQIGMEIFFRDKKYFITADRMQILNLLLSTYETAVQKNLELIKAQDELRKLNEQLEKKVEARTSDLKAEIIERNRAEEALSKVNRALRMLSECNEVLVRAKQESDLLNNICRIIVQVGGYRMAWVGYAEQDKEKTIRPVAQYGYEEGYLGRIKITWADNEMGQCPGSIAIRTGLPSVARDIQKDPTFKPWRDEALKQGYYSVIGLPLVIDKKNIGVLAIYASEPYAFNDEEMELLVELSNDLAYGIKSIRTSKEREQAEEALIESEQRYRTLVENIKLGITLIDSDYRIIMTNAAPGIFFRKPVDEFIGKECFKEFEKRSAVCEHCPGTKAMETGYPSEVETEGVRDDGSHFSVRLCAFPVFNPDGKVKGFIEVVEDIAERKRAEEAIKVSQEEIKKRVKELEEFYDMAVGRELRMVELKEEIEELKEELKNYKKSAGENS